MATAGPPSSNLSLAYHPNSIDTIICFSHLRWNFVFQRPQHLLTRAARSYRVIFVEEPSFHPIANPRLELSLQPQGVTVAVPLLPEHLEPNSVRSCLATLIDELLEPLNSVDIAFWYYTPMALDYTRHHAPRLTIYDNMDELSTFRGAPPRLVELERELFGRAAIVFTGGQSLYETKRDRHRNIHAFPSSIDKAHFASARASGRFDPADQKDLGHPRLGFFGVIDERLDINLLGYLAELRPDWQIVMIGPVAKIDPASLPRLPNIHWLGAKTYQNLPSYLGGWDLGIMPFAINEATRFISPTKTPEFLAAGIPVVSTPITDVIRPYGTAGLVEIAATAEEFAQRAELLLSRKRKDWLAAVDRQLARTSWDQTWAAMERQIERACERRPHSGTIVSNVASEGVASAV